MPCRCPKVCISNGIRPFTPSINHFAHWGNSMNARDFLATLEWLKPLPTKCNDPDLGREYVVTRLRETTTVFRKAFFTPKEEDIPDAMLDLFREVKLGNIHFNWTTFLDDPRKLNVGWQFAEMDGDMLVVADNGEVELYDHAPIQGDRFRIHRVAKDMEAYFDAMIHAGVSRSHVPTMDKTPEAVARRRLLASFCAHLAGGEAYYDFWAGVLGAQGEMIDGRLPPER